MKLRLLLIIMCFAISLIPIAVISGLQNFQIASVFLVLILGITLVVGYVIAFFISRPLMTLTKNIDEISKGNLDVELEGSEIHEINDLTVSLDRVMASLKLAIYKVGLKKEEIFQEVIKEKEAVEKKLEYLLKKIDGWIWEVDETWTCRVCSEKITDVLGYTPQQVIGKDIREFLPSDEAQRVPDLVSRLSRERQTTVNSLDFPWLHHDDHRLVWVRSFFLPQVDGSGTFHGLRCFSRNVKELHDAQTHIQQLENQLAALNQCKDEPLEKHHLEPIVPELRGVAAKEFDYMLLCDDHGKILDCTIEAQQKLGYSKKEMLSLSITDLTALESPEEIRATLDAVKTKGSTDLKTMHRRKNGTAVLVSEHLQYLSEGNRFLCQVKEEAT